LLSDNALEILKRRYLLKNDKGELIETPMHLFRRVAHAAASVEKNQKLRWQKEHEFFSLMSRLEFLPNSPTLMNAGTKIGQLSACFVLPIEDSIDSIFSALKDMAKIHQSGGGTGFNFSKIRPKGDIVHSTKGVASGPVSFIRIFDNATDVIKQGGKRRGANMAILDVSHPDIIEFVIAKKYGLLQNFNLSVAVTDEFFRKVEKNEEWHLVNPRNGKVAKTINARQLLDLIADLAWQTGDPGMLFIDEINRKNVLKQIGRIEATNPCGEQPLFNYESCNLGSINVSKFVDKAQIDWKRLKTTIDSAVEFLDNIISINNYPLPEIKQLTLANRKIGLGVMGFADMLIKLKIPYNSAKAVEVAEELMRFLTKTAREKSSELGIVRGDFPNFRKSELHGKYKHMRNATVTTIAPTGTISMIAGCSSGIEPLFAVAYVKQIFSKEKFVEINSVFKEMLEQRKLNKKLLLNEILKKGTVKGVHDLPGDMQNLFVSAHDIAPEWHVRIQAAFQKYTDNAVSKTVNLLHYATKNDVKKIFLLAHSLKCKGITIYRDKSRKEQVLERCVECRI
jgi:ribonucleoside-diphosphate reductase alpha chain